MTQTPDRLNLDVLAALCEILSCSPSDLIWLRPAGRQRAATGGNVVDMAETVRPRRARVTRSGPPSPNE